MEPEGGSRIFGEVIFTTEENADNMTCGKKFHHITSLLDSPLVRDKETKSIEAYIE